MLNVEETFLYFYFLPLKYRETPPKPSLLKYSHKPPKFRRKPGKYFSGASFFFTPLLLFAFPLGGSPCQQKGDRAEENEGVENNF